MTPFRFSLRQLQYFLAAAEASTLAKAAEALHISPAALSEALRDLEIDLETQLFVRRKSQGVSLTRAGSELAGYARSVVASAEQLQRKAEGDASNLSGRVAIGGYATLAPVTLPGLIERLGRDHPDVYVEVVEGSADEIQAQLHDGRCDAAVLYDFDLGPNTICQELFRLQPQIILAQNHRLAKTAVVDLAELSDEPFFQFGVPPAPQTAARVFAEVGVEPRITRRIINYELMRSMVARNLGYALMFHRPRSTLSLEGLGIVAKPIARSRADVGVVLARSRHIQLSPRAQKFWDISIAYLTPPASAGGERASE